MTNWRKSNAEGVQFRRFTPSPMFGGEFLWLAGQGPRRNLRATRRTGWGGVRQDTCFSAGMAGADAYHRGKLAAMIVSVRRRVRCE